MGAKWLTLPSLSYTICESGMRMPALRGLCEDQRWVTRWAVRECHLWWWWGCQGVTVMMGRWEGGFVQYSFSKKWTALTEHLLCARCLPCVEKGGGRSLCKCSPSIKRKEWRNKSSVSLRHCLAASTKAKNAYTPWLAIHFLSIYQIEMRVYVLQESMWKNAHSNFTLRHQELQTTQASRMNRLWYFHIGKRFVVYSCGGIRHGNEKEKPPPHTTT